LFMLKKNEQVCLHLFPWERNQKQRSGGTPREVDAALTPRRFKG
jgi:hypothetical protein